MSNFSGRGYITLSDLDDIENRLAKAENTLGNVDDTVNGVKDLVYYRNSSGVSKAASQLSLVKVAIEALRIRTDIKNDGTLVVTWGQDFAETPVITATVDGSKDQYACQIDSATANGCTIRFLLIGKNSNVKKDEAVCIIAIGKTKTA